MLDEKELKRFAQLLNEWQNNNSYTEKAIEFAYYNLMDKYFTSKYEHSDLVQIKYNSPYSSDGLLTIERNKIDYSILIEAKYNVNFNNKNSLIKVLCQILYYLKRIEDKQELLPAVLLLVNKNTIVTIKTEMIIEYLSGDYAWNDAASISSVNNTELYNLLYNDETIHPMIYDVSYNNITGILDVIDDYCNNSIYKYTKQPNYIIDYNVDKNNILYLDYNLMKKFSDVNKNKCIYSTNEQVWYVYADNTHWIKDNGNSVKKLILSYLAELCEDITEANSCSIYHERLVHKILTNRTINNIYKLLLIYHVGGFIPNENYISFKNNDYNLTTNELEDHNIDHNSIIYYDFDYEQSMNVPITLDSANEYINYLFSLGVMPHLSRKEIVYLLGNEENKNKLLNLLNKLEEFSYNETSNLNNYNLCKMKKI